jgi:hypothetical protein
VREESLPAAKSEGESFVCCHERREEALSAAKSKIGSFCVAKSEEENPLYRDD